MEEYQSNFFIYTIINNFKWFIVIKVKYDQQSKASHHLFYKKHKLGKKDLSDLSSRTLFVSNIPPYCTEQGLKNVFGSFGKVERVLIHSKPTPNPFEAFENIDKKSYFDFEDKEEANSFKVAYVVFTQEQSLEKSIKKPTDKEKILNKEQNISTGMKSSKKNFFIVFFEKKILF